MSGNCLSIVERRFNMETIEKNIHNLPLLDINKTLKYKDGDMDYFISREINCYVLSIPFDYGDEIINQKFVGLTLKTVELHIGNTTCKTLSLFFKENNNFDLFVMIGKNFVCKENREKIIDNPRLRAEDWINIFGDTKKKYLVSDVIAELFVLKYLFRTNKNTIWEGPNSGTHDIVTDEEVIEVKSTTNKSLFLVNINSQFQIDFNSNEYLYFVRLEKKPFAISINSLIKDLVDLGYDEFNLRDLLNQKGYQLGHKNLDETYEILEVYKYKVNEESFPKIDLFKLNQQTKSNNIIGYTLKLDLSNAKKTKVY